MEFNTANIISYSNTINSKNLSIIEQIAFCARVSNPENQNNHETSEKLCCYLIKNHHWSPFEMCNIVIEIQTTRDISRQFIRHRSFSFQEFSQRYAFATDFITRECRFQDKKNRQMSISIVDYKKNDDSTSTLKEIEISKEFEKLQNDLINIEKKYYNFCNENNIAKEQSRVILSEGLTLTKLYVNGTLRSWIHYLKIRCDINTTQREHYDLAIKIKNEISTIFPLINEIV
jgi:thymidylate synthase (FAD)